MLKFETLKFNDSLFALLKLLGIRINYRFNADSPMGYHQSNDIYSIDHYAKSLSLKTNKLSENEIIVSKKEVSLGKANNVLQKDCFIRTYYSIEEWQHIKQIYKIIQHLPSVPKMTFPEEKVIKLEFIEGTTLFETKNIFKTHRDKFLEFIYSMNQFGYVHRDLHCKNILVSNDNIFIIDWDFVTEQACELTKSYDITGSGLPSPHLTQRCHIFKSFPNLRIPSVADILHFTMNDLNEI